jgi:hypothetical protein
LESAWVASVLPALSGRARARYNAGTFTAVDDAAEFALPNPIHRDRCEELREEVEAALAAHFGRPVPLRLVVSAGGSAAPQERPAPASSAAPAPKRAPEPVPNDDPFDEPSPRDVAAPDRTADDAGDEDGDDIDIGDIAALEDADDVAVSSVDRLTELFPGAEVVEE